MHGNVWEWCLDWWVGSSPGGSLTDPWGPSSGSYRVMRGGRWCGVASACCSVSRSYYRPGGRGYGIGFRPVLAPGHLDPLDGVLIATTATLLGSREQRNVKPG